MWLLWYAGIRSLQKGRNSTRSFLLVAYNRKNTNHEDRTHYLREEFHAACLRVVLFLVDCDTNRLFGRGRGAATCEGLISGYEGIGLVVRANI